MDRAKLEALEKLLAKATHADWRLHPRSSTTVLAGDGYSATQTDSNTFDSTARNEANAELIVAAVNALPALLRLARAAVDDSEFPAFLTHSQAWPQGYVHGFNDALLLVRQQGFGPRVDDDTLREFKGVVLRADAADTTAGEG